VEQHGLTEVALELAVLHEPLQPALQALVKGARPIRQGAAVFLGEGDGQSIGLELARLPDFDRELVHRAAIVPKQGFTVPLRNLANRSQL
jgi:hypothetical protein